MDLFLDLLAVPFVLLVETVANGPLRMATSLSSARSRSWISLISTWFVGEAKAPIGERSARHRVMPDKIMRMLIHSARALNWNGGVLISIVTDAQYGWVFDPCGVIIQKRRI